MTHEYKQQQPSLPDSVTQNAALMEHVKILASSLKAGGDPSSQTDLAEIREIMHETRGVMPVEFDAKLSALANNCDANLKAAAQRINSSGFGLNT